MNGSNGQNRTKGGHPGSTTSSIPEKRSCEKDEQCGLWAECVSFNHNEPKRCWCVNDLKSPDPDTGGCRSTSSGPPHDKSINGVLLSPHLRDIVLHADSNVTAGRMANESTALLHLPAVEPAVLTSWAQIILPALGSFVFVAIIVLFSVIYRRRFMIKEYCANRQPGIYTRHNDGVILLDRMNYIKNNPTYFCQNSVLTRRHNFPEVSCEHLKLEEVVGEGAFGQVFRGNLLNPDNATHRQVAVKVLRDGTTPETRQDFEREVEIMSAFDHDNILKLLGVVVRGMDGNPYMIFEYMEHGDLSELLRKIDPLMRVSTRKTINFSKADLVDVCVQIANGMSYLAAQRFVHRDLATRNCLVGNGLIVKISDFGMSRDIYTTDYYKVGGSRMLPVRWMSPEAIKYGRFTCESDIWAYGVVLWEIFSYGKQPYCGHTNDEVIHFLDQGILLQRPEDCPSTVYHVMLGCWKKDPRERIAFERLAKYLTDFRNILTKSVHSPQQHHSDVAVDEAKNSDIDVYVVDIPGKADVIADASQNQYTHHVGRSLIAENNADELNYICIGNFANKDSVVSIPSVRPESPIFTNTVCEANCISAPNSTIGSNINSEASNTSGSFDFWEKQQTQYMVTNESFPTRHAWIAQETCLQDVLSSQQPTEPSSEKTPARKTSSCPLSLQKDKQYRSQKDTGMYRNNGIINQQISFCGHNNLSSQTLCVPKCQRNKINNSSSSALDLSLSWTSLSEAPVMSADNTCEVKSGSDLYHLTGATSLADEDLDGAPV